jgi:hypothetical protein
MRCSPEGREGCFAGGNRSEATRPG